jgi:hypothetical protein
MCVPGALGLAGAPVARMIGRNPAWALAPGLGLLLGKDKKRPSSPALGPMVTQGTVGPAPSYGG